MCAQLPTNLLVLAQKPEVSVLCEDHRLNPLGATPPAEGSVGPSGRSNPYKNVFIWLLQVLVEACNSCGMWGLVP